MRDDDTKCCPISHSVVIDLTQRSDRHQLLQPPELLSISFETFLPSPPSESSSNPLTPHPPLSLPEWHTPFLSCTCVCMRKSEVEAGVLLACAPLCLLEQSLLLSQRSRTPASQLTASQLAPGIRMLGSGWLPHLSSFYMGSGLLNSGLCDYMSSA